MNLVSGSFDALGLAFDPALALLNHSCNPNAAIVFNRNIASLRSIKDIAEGEQITISYADNTFKRAARRLLLRDQYFFECRCLGCEPPDNTFTGRDCWLCDNEACKALIPPPYSSNDRLVCPQCNKTQAATLNSLRDLEINALHVLDSIRKNRQRTAPLINAVLVPTLQSLISCPSWPPTRQPVPALHKEAYLLAIEFGYLEVAFHHADILATPPHLELYPEPFHPLRSIAYFTPALLLAEMAATKNSVDYLKRSWELLAVAWALCQRTHGESDFAKRVAKKRSEVEHDLSMGGEELRQWMRQHTSP
jgi:SET domain